MFGVEILMDLLAIEDRLGPRGDQEMGVAK
jgi:hypothetical protein